MNITKIKYHLSRIALGLTVSLLTATLAVGIGWIASNHPVIMLIIVGTPLLALVSWVCGDAIVGFIKND